VKEYFKLYESHIGKPFPKNPREQLHLAINAVFRSWDNARARTYRNLHKIPHDMGTAVNVQEMVYGNMGDDSATGVAFTRNPSTGENKRFGEYLKNAQGEDVVAGIRTPSHIEDMQKEFPEPFKQLYEAFELLENHYKDMQDVEFTIERNKLYILQTRSGKRTAAASVKIAVDMVAEGLIPKSEALLRVSPSQLETLLHKQLDPVKKKSAKVLAKGLPASPGAAVGQIVFEADVAVAAKEQGKKTILVRLETSPEDISGMVAAQGILTARGGMTSHAAVVARGMNIPCIAGCSDIRIDAKSKTMGVGNKTLKEWDWITLDGSDGEWYEGKLPVVDPDLKGEFGVLLKYADEFRKLDIYGNADTPKDAKIARDFGAVGIGLVRTEHMFFNPQRILAVREMIVAETKEARDKALDKLLPYQRDDFEGILDVMDGLPVVIRLIDPPLHEFLPKEKKEIEELARAAGIDVPAVEKKIVSMHEFNPMLGFRGCRLGVVYPEINAMQVTAIFEAAVKLAKRGKKPRPHIEIPLVGKTEEFVMLKHMIVDIAKKTGADDAKVHYAIGTMIEVPRAAVVADELAKEAQFMSFGTNDLTQMTCGFSRDDAASFLKAYVEKGIYASDPFQSIDQDGVGLLMKACVSLARSVNPSIDFGICGEHAGDPASVEFCHRIRLNNVSPSPYRVPIARLAAAQAAIKYGQAPIAVPVFMKAKL
jgi:pyruvate,orthophosphate dikinase